MNLVLAHVQQKRPLAQIGAGHVAKHVLGAESLRLLAHVLDQFRPLNSFREAGKFSTKVVIDSCPPGSWPSMTSGLRLARAL